MGEAKREQNNRVIRASTRRYMQRLAISAVGCALADKITKAKDDFYLMNPNPDTKATFKFLDAELVV